MIDPVEQDGCTVEHILILAVCVGAKCCRPWVVDVVELHSSIDLSVSVPKVDRMKKPVYCLVCLDYCLLLMALHSNHDRSNFSFQNARVDQGRLDLPARKLIQARWHCFGQKMS